MSLKTADQVLKTIAKPRTRKRKQFTDEVTICCGSTKWKDRKKIKSILSTLDPASTMYVVTGTSKGAELLVLQVARELKLPVVQVHQQAHFGSNSLQMRNGKAFAYFKPTRVIAFHDNIDESVSSAYYLKLAKKKGIEHTLVTSTKTTTVPARS